MEDESTLRMVRAAENQALCREVNERIEALANQYAVELQHRDFICECADTACSTGVRLTVSEYEAVRTDPKLFIVCPSDDHVVPDAEEVAAKHERYWTVRKIGVAGEIAAKVNPRARAGERQS